MKNVLKSGAIVLAVAALSPVAFADSAETKGGLKVKTDDGRFEFGLGGRIHYDVNVFVDDDDAPRTSSSFFRRARITLSGKAYGWEYKFEEDFAGSGGRSTATVCTNDACDETATVLTSASTVTARDMYIATKLGPGKLTIGQFKPYRGMEEMTSSNEITVMERGFSSASGIIGNQFQTGLGYLVTQSNYTAGLALYNMRNDSGSNTEGVGSSGRVTFAPLNEKGSVLHLGGWASVDNPHRATVGSSSVRYAGRLGPSQSIGATAPSRERTMYGAELAGVFGPFFFQSEYVQATLDQDTAADQDVTSYYAMASVHVTGESKPYSKGVFKSVKPASSMGAVELVTKYDFIENQDIAAMPEVTSITLGANYYVNPNVRFMLNYIMGEAKAGGTTTEIDVLAARAQFNF